MNNALKDGLIRAMKDKMPGGNNLASALTEILCIGKEAVYRRLRGEVAFTFNEAAVISRELGISLDNRRQLLPRKHRIRPQPSGND